MRKILFVSAFILILGASTLVVYAMTWPSNLIQHNDIVIDATDYQPSGLAWNQTTNKLFTVCNTGKITKMNPDGSNQETKVMSTYLDFEAITLVNPDTNLVYIGIENPDSIMEYDWTPAGAGVVGLTGRTWNLTGIMNGADNSGLEGLTFVPNGYHPFANSTSGGLFYAAIQRQPVLNDAVTYNDYLIYAFDIDLSTSNHIVAWYGLPIAPNIPNYDISDLYFSQDTGVLYVLYDDANRLIEMKTDGIVIRDYDNVPVPAQEGLVIKTNYPSLTADIYLGSDTNKLIGWYSGYTVNFDVDGDGVENKFDCAINNSTLSTKNTFYQDLDSDGLGSDLTVSVCANTPPTGYVTNSNDLDDNDADNDFDNDGVTTDLDCNDHDKTVSINQTYFLDVDKDGLGSDTQITVCSSTAPTGYVMNSDDANDSDFDNDGASSNVDCNDTNPNIKTTTRYFKDYDKDGLGSATVFVDFCSITAPATYVTNSNDLNDNDFDNDGVSADVDCNDKDKTIAYRRHYYEDKDKDGLGSKISIFVCSVNIPVGYTINSNDLNDNDYDNDGVSSNIDCNDKNKLVAYRHRYYEDKDKDGLGSKISIFVCVATIPSGYVTNSNDLNDNDHDNDGVSPPQDKNDYNAKIK